MFSSPPSSAIAAEAFFRRFWFTWFKREKSLSSSSFDGAAIDASHAVTVSLLAESGTDVDRRQAIGEAPMKRSGAIVEETVVA